MLSYKLTNNSTIPVVKTQDGIKTEIPNAEDNRDWQEYQEWLAQGNEPDPAD